MDQRGIQVSGTGKDSVFPATGDSSEYMECSGPTSVTPKEGELHVRSVVTEISFELT